jgi:uncharacterized membrane protein
VELSIGGFKFTSRTLSFIILAFAIGVSGYLSYLKLTDTSAVCLHGGKFDCGTVLSSRYSELGGVPIAYLGLATNLIIVALLIFTPRMVALRDYEQTLVFAVVLFEFLFSVYLVYIQAERIGAYCPWCLSHEGAITLLFLVSSWRVWKMFQPVEEEPVLQS